MRKSLFWLFSSLTLAILNYFYNPTLVIAAIGTAFCLVLLLFMTWSLARIGGGARSIVVTSVIGLVAGFMISKGLDVTYQLLAAPEGMRFILPLETVMFSLVLAFWAIASRTVFGSKEEKQSSGDKAD